MRRPAEVLHVLGTGREYGKGVAHIVENLTRNLDPRKFRTSAWFLRDTGPLSDKLESAGARVHEIRWTGGWKDLGGALRFARALRKERFDIIHLHTGGMSTRLIAKASPGARLVLHVHSLAQESAPGTRRNHSGNGVDLVIANSRATAARIAGCTPLVVYPSVDVAPRARSRFTPRGSNDRVTIGVAARLVPVKGIEYLLSAIGGLSANGPEVRLHVAGSGPDQSRLKREAQRAGISERVNFVGWTHDVPALMDQWDIYVQPSLAEGFGIAVLEAMAAGLPVVATNAGGLAEIVEHGVTGWLVPPGDSGALGGCIARLVRDPAERLRMGQAGRDRVARVFSAEKEAIAIQSAYARLLKW